MENVVTFLSGEPPFYDLDPVEAIEAIADAIENDITLRENASEDAIQFVEKCLKHNPDERYDASELLRLPFMMKKCDKSDFKRFLDEWFDDAEVPPPPRSSGCVIS